MFLVAAGRCSGPGQFSAAQQQWLSGEIGKAVGAAFGNEGAGFSGSTREVTYNYLKHDEARALIEARKNGDTEEVARLETLDRARDKELAAAAIQGGAKYTKLLREAQTAAAGYFGNQDLLGMDAAGEAEYVRDLKHANDVVENVTEFSGALALGKGKATVTGDPLGDWKINFEGGTQIEKPDSRNLRGSLSERYETGGRGPGTVSTGVGDLGGYRMEATSSLLRWVAHRNFWPPTVGRGRPDLRTWIRPYAMANLPRCGERLAAPNPTLFSRHSIISSRKLIMMFRSHILQTTGLNINAQPAAVQDAVWPTAVHNGPKNSVVQRAVARLGDMSSDSPGYSRSLIDAIYDERSKTMPDGSLAYFRKSSAKVQAGVSKRFVNERTDALKMLNGGN